MVTLTVTKKQDLILRPCFFCVLRGLSITEMKPQILSLCSQRKGSARSSKINGSLWPTDFCLPPLSEISKGSFQRSKLDRWFQVSHLTTWFLHPEFTKSSLKKVAKYGKIKALQKKEVLQWRRKNMKACASCPLRAACCVKMKGLPLLRTESPIIEYSLKSALPWIWRVPDDYYSRGLW